MTASVPVPRRFPADPPDVRLVDQCGRLERLSVVLLSHPGSGEPAQFVVDERKQLRGGLGIAGTDRGQDLRDVGYDAKHSSVENAPRWENGPGVGQCLPKWFENTVQGSTRKVVPRPVLVTRQSCV